MTSTTTDLDAQLRTLLQKLESKTGVALSPSTRDAQLVLVVEALHPDTPAHTCSLAFLILTRLVSNARPKLDSASEEAQEKATQALSKLFHPLIEARLATTSAKEVLEGLGLLAALFQVDAPTAGEILLRDGVIETVMDVPDLFEGEDGRKVARAVAGLLSQASGSKACRPAVSSHARAWLQDQSKQTGDNALRAAAAIALTKLSRGTAEDASSLSGLGGSPAEATEPAAGEDEEALAQLMKSLVISSTSPIPSDDPTTTSQGTLDAIEGLAYISSDPKTKEMLSSDTAFLTRLFALVPPLRRHQTGPVPVVDADKSDPFAPGQPRGSLALLYGIAVIIANIVALRPQLTEEEKQIDRLKKMTKEGARTGAKLGEAPPDPSEALEDTATVKRRCKRLLKAGVVPALVAISSRVESEGVRRAAGRAFLSLVEDKENRGKVTQGGGVKALLGIIRASFGSLDSPSQPTPPKPRSKFDSTPQTTARSLDPLDLPPIQALAKLSITSSPLLLFGPDPSSSIDALRPLGHLLLNPSSTLLQRFEALMGLTNIASLGPPIASRVASQKETGLGTVLTKAETLLLDDHTMVRRAAMELLCNLIASDEVWERYTGEKPDGKVASDDASQKAIVNRLQVVMAMADVDDAPTRLAASGALAMLTSSQNVCKAFLEKMENGAQKVFRILVEALVPSAGTEEGEEEPLAPSPSPEVQSQLAYRGVVCLRNLLPNYASSKPSKDALTAVVKEVKGSGMPEALVRALTAPENAGNQEMIGAGAELLKWIIGQGVEVVV